MKMLSKILWIKKTLIFLSLIGLALSPFLFTLWPIRTGSEIIDSSLKIYREAESSPIIFGRQEGFNKALDLFLKLEEEYQPNYGTGKLSYNIGNTYFELEEYALAILYYKRAESLMPRSVEIRKNLQSAQQKLGLKGGDDPYSLFDRLLEKPYLSLPERLQIFFISAVLTLFFSSLILWKKRWGCACLAWIFFSLSLLILSNLILSFYFSPIEAVLTHSVQLRRDIGFQFAKVKEEPLQKGIIVEVLKSSPDGQWVKIQTPDGEFGYIPSQSLQLIEKAILSP